MRWRDGDFHNMKHLNASLGVSKKRAGLVVETGRSPASFAGRDVLSLDGTWALAFDPENRGREERWHAAFPFDSIAAPVPAVWEKVRPGYDGVGWYRRDFLLPAGWSGRSLRLRFHAAQYHAEVWLNGDRLGGHEGGFLPFEFPVSDKVREGENTLVVRVVNPPMDREVDGFRCGAPLNQGPIPVGKAGWYYNFGGLWQSVELLATEGAAIARIVPEPSLEREEVAVKVAVELDGPSGVHEIACEISGADLADRPPVVTTRKKLGTGLNRFVIKVKLPGARRWSPEDPWLHGATVTVRRDGHVCDRHSVRFGMREFKVVGERFELNGRPVVLKGFLHQGSYPRDLVRPENRAFAERELRAVKDHGFNFVRAHLQPALPEWLDLCDELGLLVMAEPPIGWIERTTFAEERCWREIKGLLERDAHHASIVMWGLMNEVFHLRGFSPRVVIGMTTRWLARVAKIDPTRPVIDVSGGHGLMQGGGAADMLPDTASLGHTALMVAPGSAEPRRVTDAHIYHDFPPGAQALRKFRAHGSDGRLFFLSEFGAPPLPPRFDEVTKAYSPKERAAGLEDFRLHADFAGSLRGHFRHPAPARACGDPGRFIDECNRLRAEEMYEVTTILRTNPNVAGYCFCQLADASGELFGALDFWRRPKPAMTALAEAADAGTLAVMVTPRVAFPGEKVEVELVWLGGDHARPAGPKGAWSLELSGEDGAVEQRWSGTFVPETGVPRVLLKAEIAAPRKAGVWKWRASGIAGPLTLHGRIDARIIARPARLRGETGVGGGGAMLSQALASLGLAVSPYGNNFREAELPVFFDCSVPCPSRQLWFEEMGQLRKIMQVGGCAVLFEPEMALVNEVVPEAAVRMQPIMRSAGYAVVDKTMGGLPGGLMDFAWAELLAGKYDRADDVAARGGEVLAGTLSFNMWTRPAAFFHGASLYTLPVGRGTLVVCHLKVLSALAAGRPEAGALLAGLVGLARSKICVEDTRALLSRCIDPIC